MFIFISYTVEIISNLLHFYDFGNHRLRRLFYYYFFVFSQATQRIEYNSFIGIEIDFIYSVYHKLNVLKVVRERKIEFFSLRNASIISNIPTYNKINKRIHATSYTIWQFEWFILVEYILYFYEKPKSCRML